MQVVLLSCLEKCRSNKINRCMNWQIIKCSKCSSKEIVIDSHQVTLSKEVKEGPLRGKHWTRVLKGESEFSRCRRKMKNIPGLGQKKKKYGKRDGGIKRMA